MHIQEELNFNNDQKALHHETMSVWLLYEIAFFDPQLAWLVGETTTAAYLMGN